MQSRYVPKGTAICARCSMTFNNGAFTMDCDIIQLQWRLCTTSTNMTFTCPSQRRYPQHYRQYNHRSYLDELRAQINLPILVRIDPQYRVNGQHNPPLTTFPLIPTSPRPLHRSQIHHHNTQYHFTNPLLTHTYFPNFNPNPQQHPKRMKLLPKLNASSVRAVQFPTIPFSSGSTRHMSPH